MPLKEMLGYALIAALLIALVVTMTSAIIAAIKGDEEARMILVIMAVMTAPVWLIGTIAWCFSG